MPSFETTGRHRYGVLYKRGSNSYSKSHVHSKNWISVKQATLTFLTSYSWHMGRTKGRSLTYHASLTRTSRSGTAHKLGNDPLYLTQQEKASKRTISTCCGLGWAHSVFIVLFLSVIGLVRCTALSFVNSCHDSLP